MPRALLAVSALLTACFSAPAEVPPKPASPATLTVEGELCASPAFSTPARVLIAIDASSSVSVTDPTGSRAAAVTALLEALPQGADLSVAVMLFAGSTRAFVLDPAPKFTPLSRVGAAERAALAARITSFAQPGPANDSTDFVAALAAIRSLVSVDLEAAHLAAPFGPAPTYSIVFISDGRPSANQDELLLCQDAVGSIRALSTFATSVRLHTVHVFSPTVDPGACDPNLVPTAGAGACRLPEWPAGTCAARLVADDALRLQRMAELGGGEFHDFRDGAPVDLGFVQARLHPRFSVGAVLLTNASAAPGSLEPDSDQDGLYDALEAALRTDPDRKDTDGDGFGDGVERWVRSRGEAFEPTRLDPGCEHPGADADCDGLTDCDERLLQTNPARQDTDDDGLPDGVELLAGTRPQVRDNLLDADADGVSNGDEVRSHSDPLTRDPAAPDADYRYTLQPSSVSADGAQCYRLKVENITLPATRSGTSALSLSVSLRSLDEPTDRPLMLTLAAEAAAGTAHLTFSPEQLRAACGP